MPQHDLIIANDSGAAVRADINNALAALGSTQKGPTPPPAPIAGMLWIEDDSPTTTIWTLRIYDGSDWIVIGTIDSTNNTFGIPSITSGLRNLVINGNPTINQRGYVSGAAVAAANTYTLDRWRVVVSGQSVSWSDSAGVRTVTAPVGGMEQVVEGASIDAGIYTLSWVGTASATVNGNAVANGGQATLSGGANATIRMTDGTWSRLQLEPGRVATSFERRPAGVELALCQRYYWQTDAPITLGGTMMNGIGATTYQHVGFPVEMRTAPTQAPIFGSGLGNASQALVNVGRAGFTIQLTANGAGNGGFAVTLNAGCAFSAEF
jgi:hypothetical protein